MVRGAHLSIEISRARALIVGGASPGEVLHPLRQWAHQAPRRGTRRVSSNLIAWNKRLCEVVRDALPLGAPVGELFREAQAMVKREEKLWARLKGVERQLGFQGAMAIVLPWAVAVATEGLQINVVSMCGILLQVVGLALFYYFTKSALREPQLEQTWLFEFLLGVWMRVISGTALFKSIETGLTSLTEAERTESSLRFEWRQAWLRWLRAIQSGSGAMPLNGRTCSMVNDYEALFSFPHSTKKRKRWALASSRSFTVSAELASIFETLLRTGAPAGTLLRDYLSQIEEDRQEVFEDRIAQLPSRLSLVFCFFLAPAVFLLLLGALWPTLKALSL